MPRRSCRSTFRRPVSSRPGGRDATGEQRQAGRPDGNGDGGQRPRQFRPPVPVDLSVVSDVRDKLARWNEPAARLERRKRRASRFVTLLVILTLLSGLWALGGYFGVTSAQEGFEGAFGGLVAVVVFGVLGTRTMLHLRRLNRTEVPKAAAAPPKLPPKGSAAREPMERLAEGEASLRELLTQLSTPSPGAPASVPEMSVADARATATEAADALRALAARVQSIERARASAPEAERPALDSAIRTLRTQLDDGLDGYGALVAAAGRAVAASSGGVQPAKEALTDATDRLAGLALALRELS